MKKHITLAAIIVAALALSAPSLAAEEKRGFYLAPEIGQLTFKDYCVDSHCEDGEISYGLSGGYWFNDVFAAEGGVRLASGFKDRDFAPNGDLDAEFELDARSFNIGGRGKFPVGTHFFVTGKTGVHFWNNKIKDSVSGVTVKTDGTDLYFGLGVGFNFNERIGAVVDYTRYKYDSANGDLIAANVVIKF